MAETREIVVPGEQVGSTEEMRPGQNTYQEGKGIYALRLGVKKVRGDHVNIISLSGRYEPARGDMVIGTIVEVGPSNWYVDIGAANDVGMHVNDVPWRVEFGETAKYLAVGESVLLKIVHVDEIKKAQVSMKDRQCRKLTGGLIYEVSSSKVPRIVGRNGSMISLIKDATSVRLFVGQNGVIWLDGEPEDVALALEAIQKIEAEAHTTGLTERMKAWLEERRPAALRPAREGAEEEEEAAEEEAAEEEAEEGGEEGEEARPRRRRARPLRIEEAEEPAEEADEGEEEAEERPKKTTSRRRSGGGGGRGKRGGRSRGGKSRRGSKED